MIAKETDQALDWGAGYVLHPRLEKGLQHRRRAGCSRPWKGQSGPSSLPRTSPHSSGGGGKPHNCREGAGLHWVVAGSGPAKLAGDTYQEGAKHGDGREEVPDVVVVEEGQQDTLPVVLSGLGRRFLWRAVTSWAQDGQQAGGRGQAQGRPAAQQGLRSRCSSRPLPARPNRRARAQPRGRRVRTKPPKEEAQLRQAAPRQPSRPRGLREAATTPPWPG